MALNFEKISAKVESHFNAVSTLDFQQNVEKYCVELTEKNMSELTKVEKETNLLTFPVQPLLFTPNVPLDAYLACALTGLDETQRQLMFQLSDTVATVCEDLNIKLYEPRKNTDPVHNKDVSDKEVFRLDREKVLNSDLIIHLCHYPSTGAGEELAFANDGMVPIILISHNKNRVSRMITGIPGFKVEIKYEEPEELRQQLRDILIRTRPVLEERNAAFSQYSENIVGERIRHLREDLGLTREELVTKMLPPITVEALQQIEDSTDKVSNPTLVQLRQIAVMLKTTVADLVEPSMNSLVISKIDEILNQKIAARSGAILPEDQKRILRRTLRQMIDVLDREND